jgi:hypothetical protein
MGVTLHFVDNNLDTSTPKGREIMQFLAIAAESESAAKSVRLKAKAKWMRDNNMPHDGRHKIGHKIINKGGKKFMMPSLEEISLISLARILHDAKGFTWAQAADYANAIYCWKHKLTPQPRAIRKHPQIDEHLIKRRNPKLDFLIAQLPLNAAGEIKKEVANYLTCTIPQEFLRHCQAPDLSSVG